MLRLLTALIPFVVTADLVSGQNPERVVILAGASSDEITKSKAIPSYFLFTKGGSAWTQTIFSFLGPINCVRQGFLEWFLVESLDFPNVLKLKGTLFYNVELLILFTITGCCFGPVFSQFGDT
jgi:hypothetical protein